MALEYIMLEHQRYDGCISIKLRTSTGQGNFYLPPWETAQYCVDAIIDECVRFQLEQFFEVRVDSDGRLFTTKDTRRGQQHKTLIPGAISIPDIIKQLKNTGYELPENYWHQHHNNQRLRHLHLQSQ